MTLDQYHDKVLIAALRARGYIVLEDKRDWERPCEFSRRHGKHPTYLSKRLGKTPPPPKFECELGKTRRTIRLRSNPELEAWMQGR